jgi:hypothetical protein
MKKERSYMIESTAWLVATVLLIAVMLSSCGSTHGCHSKGAYVPKSIKKAQAKPYAHN